MADSGFSLDGQRVLVTGASVGIGAAIASRLANAGATVVVVSRSGEVPQPKGAMHSLVADLSEPEETDTVIERAVDLLGGLDVLVNNVGRADPMPFADVDRDYFNAYVELNLWAPLRLCQHAYEHLAQSNDPSVVMIGSVDAERPSPGSVVYGATKGALSAATVALSKEWMAAGIRVNQVNPGLVDTQLASEIVHSLKESGESINIAGRVGLPDEIAGLVHYLVAPVGRFANGASFRIDGGALALGPFDRWQQ